MPGGSRKGGLSCLAEAGSPRSSSCDLILFPALSLWGMLPRIRATTGSKGDGPVNVNETQVEYEAPKVTDYGDLVELTAAGSGGDCLDMDFHAGQNKAGLTFSSC